MTYKNIILISVFALSGVYLGLYAETAEMAALVRTAISNNNNNASTSNAHVPTSLIDEAEPLVEKMLLGGTEDKPQYYAEKLVSLLLKSIKSGTLSNETKELLESIKGTLKRCSESNTVWTWSELRDAKFRSLLSKPLLAKIDKMNTMSLINRL